MTSSTQKAGGASSLAGFLATLPPDRRQAVERVWKMVRQHMPSGYEEAISKGMLIYQVPLERYPDTYNGHPLWYVALASQKSYVSLYLMAAYGDPASARLLKDGFKAAGKKLDMGKSCIHFKSADDLELDVIGKILASFPMERWIGIAKAARKR